MILFQYNSVRCHWGGIVGYLT